MSRGCDAPKNFLDPFKGTLLVDGYAGYEGKTKIWRAVATYVLIAIARKQLQLDTSMYACLQILSVSVFEKIQLSRSLQVDSIAPDPADSSSPLLFFGF